MTLRGNVLSSGIFRSAIFGGAGGVAGNGLLNNLIAYWPGNEAAGNALDLHTNALHLTDTNTVTNAAGLVYPTARQYTAANLEYHTRAGDDALLSTGDVDFTVAAWCRMDTIPLAAGIASKFVVVGQYEYGLYYRGVTNAFRFTVSNDGTAIIPVDAVTLGLPVINTWYLVVGWHDSVANTLNIQINNGGVDSVAHATGVFNSTSPFRVGQVVNANYMNGRIGPTMFWKSAGGGGGCLSSAKRTALWNGGLGLPYANFTL